MIKCISEYCVAFLQNTVSEYSKITNVIKTFFINCKILNKWKNLSNNFFKRFKITSLKLLEKIFKKI